MTSPHRIDQSPLRIPVIPKDRSVIPHLRVGELPFLLAIPVSPIKASSSVASRSSVSSVSPNRRSGNHQDSTEAEEKE